LGWAGTYGNSFCPQLSPPQILPARRADANQLALLDEERLKLAGAAHQCLHQIHFLSEGMPQMF
jgi:hypothetical protein